MAMAPMTIPTLLLAQERDHGIHTRDAERFPAQVDHGEEHELMELAGAVLCHGAKRIQRQH